MPASLEHQVLQYEVPTVPYASAVLVVQCTRELSRVHSLSTTSMRAVSPTCTTFIVLSLKVRYVLDEKVRFSPAVPVVYVDVTKAL